MLKCTALFQLPVWDESVSIFPAADYLAQHNFNMVDMLETQKCGLHWVSLMSLVTALSMVLLGNGAALWIFLHVLQWIMGAATVVMLIRILSPFVGDRLAFLSGLLFLTMPVTLAQLGFMYLEIPLAMFCLGAVFMHLNGRVWMTVAMCCFACFTKEQGFIVASALGIAAFLEGKNWKIGAKKGLLYIIPSLLILLISMLAVAKIDLNPGHVVQANLILRIQTVFMLTGKLFIQFFPDQIVLYALSLILSLALLGRMLFLPWEKRVEALSDPRTRLMLVSSIFMLVFLGFYHIMVPMVWWERNYLPRYILQALPFIVILSVLWFRSFCNPRLISAIFLLLIVLSLINRRGLFYPAIPFNDISLAERSEEYVDGYIVTRDCLAAVEKEIPRDVPIYFCSFTYALTQNPHMGYVSRPLLNAVDVSSSPLFTVLDFTRLPDHFFAVYNYDWFGGDKILSLMLDAYEPDSTWDGYVRGVFPRGSFKVSVVEFTRKKKLQP